MPLRFACTDCSKDIYMRFLKPGEEGRCPHCGATIIVPDDAETVDSIPDEYKKVPRPEPKSLFDDLSYREKLEQIDAREVIRLRGLSISLYIGLTIVILCGLAHLIITILPYLQPAILSNLNRIDTMFKLVSAVIQTETWINFMVFGIFLIWFYIANHNLHIARVPGLRYKPIWTATGTIIPFVNLVMPYVMMHETWRGSIILAGKAKREDIEDRYNNNRVAYWWFFALSSVIILMISVFLQLTEYLFSPSIIPDIAKCLGLIFQAVAGILLMLLISEITDNQETGQKFSIYKALIAEENYDPENLFPGSGKSEKGM